MTNPFITSGAAVGIDVKNVGPGAVIKNNIVDTVTTPDTGGNGTAQAIYLEAGRPPEYPALWRPGHGLLATVLASTPYCLAP